MEIRFVSSLTADDENFFAPALVKALSAIMDQLPIAYTLRIETTGAQVFQHTHAGAEGRETPAELEAAGRFIGSIPGLVPRITGQAHR